MIPNTNLPECRSVEELLLTVKMYRDPVTPEEGLILAGAKYELRRRGITTDAA